MVCGMPFPPSLQEREAAHRQPCKKVVHIRVGVLACAEHGRWRDAEAFAVKVGIHSADLETMIDLRLKRPNQWRCRQ